MGIAEPARGPKSLPEVTALLAFSRDEPSSIVSSLIGARENARGIRESLSSELWECLNATYVALDQGFFKAEGLDGSLLELDPRSQVTGVISGNLDCAPIPSGGAQAALSGAKIMYIVGESLKSQWTITTRQDIGKPEDLRGKTLGYGRQGGADYDEAQAVLHRFYQMDSGRDYKVISFQGEPERIAAMINNDILGASLSIPHAAVAVQAGLKILLRTGDYIPRAGGTIWCLQSFVEKNLSPLWTLSRNLAR
jgi:ABC-type nitrate/sulfonate/bicarbonate transport system substrate-binding protein